MTPINGYFYVSVPSINKALQVHGFHTDVRIIGFLSLRNKSSSFNAMSSVTENVIYGDMTAKIYLSQMIFNCQFITDINSEIGKNNQGEEKGIVWRGIALL